MKYDKVKKVGMSILEKIIAGIIVGILLYLITNFLIIRNKESEESPETATSSVLVEQYSSSSILGSDTLQKSINLQDTMEPPKVGSKIGEKVRKISVSSSSTAVSSSSKGEEEIKEEGRKSLKDGLNDIGEAGKRLQKETGKIDNDEFDNVGNGENDLKNIMGIK